jgi:hypothetical protein
MHNQANGFFKTSQGLRQLGWRVHNIMNGYGRYLRQRKTCEPLKLPEVGPDYHTQDDDPFSDLPL